MDWVALFTDNNIEFVSRGPNTRKGEISIRCPICGDDDPSQHLGIALDKEAWGCHRNQQHRGKDPKRLIQALLNCSSAQAALVVAQYNQADPDSLPTLENAPAAPVGPTEALKLLPEFKPIPEKGRFYNYLKNRGFDDPLELTTFYNVRCCTTGRWKDRIIIPVYHDDKLVAWTGRALQNPVMAPRYLSTSEAIKQTIWQSEDAEAGGKILFITEGPFDALKVDYYGAAYEASAVAVFGTSITPDQIAILSELSRKFVKTVILLDTDAVEAAFALSDWLNGAIIGTLPEGIKDPGQLTSSQINKLLTQF